MTKVIVLLFWMTAHGPVFERHAFEQPGIVPAASALNLGSPRSCEAQVREFSKVLQAQRRYLHRAPDSTVGFCEYTT